jgi:1-acyl-sn-glycerol-3-phosphate acyltransferase
VGTPGDFSKLPFVAGSYRSPAAAPSRLAAAFPGLAFYRRAAGIVWRAGRQAARGRYDDAAWSRSSLAIFRALEKAGVRIAIDGADHFLALEGPCVFIGNHMSTCETFLLPTIIRPSKPVTFIVKRELTEYPVFGHVMRSRDPILVGRSNPREDLKAVLEGGVRRLQAGISIIVFPQTTRTPVFDPAAFNSIGVKLAKRAQVPVVPVALKTDAWGNGRIVKDVGRIDPTREVRFAFGEPLRVQGTGAAEHQQVVDFIRRNLLAWGGTVQDGPGPGGTE